MKVIAQGLGFPEEPRLRDGAIWFIDTVTRRINTVELATLRHSWFDTGFAPGGLGWLPTGELVVVDGTNHRLVAIEGFDRSRRIHADLAAPVRVRPNGLAVTTAGVAYVAMLGSEITDRHDRNSGSIVRVEPDGTARTILDDDLMFPNGVAITPTGELLVAETFGRRVSVLSLDPHGSVAGRQTVDLDEPWYPDGCWHGADDTIWVADAGARRCLQLDRTGTVLAEITSTDHIYACVLDEAGRTLYLCTAPGHDDDSRSQHAGTVVEHHL